MQNAPAREGQNDDLVFRASAAEIGFAPERAWCPAPDVKHRTEPYRVPKVIRIGTRDTSEAAARFSPSPCAVILERGVRRVFVGVRAEAGWHVWNDVSFEASREGIVLRVDLEGHTSPREAARHVHLDLIPGEPREERHALLRRALAGQYPAAHAARPQEPPAWWGRPIYCGWGDQVGMSLALEGPGPEPRALAYCIQGLYERWIRRLDEAEAPVGTVIVDGGWSQAGVWKPDPLRWPDLKGFIARQHDAGRRVLMWIATWCREGLPDKWCIRSGKIPLVADPTHPAYRRFLADQVHQLLSPGGYDADGFKIDQLACVPSERLSWASMQFGRRTELPARHARIRTTGPGWGCELLYQLQKDIYRAAKAAKPDALVTSSTVHPYFHDTFDMARLHDTGVVKGDSVEAMKARSDLSRAALPRHLIDADDWIPYDFGKWLCYTLNSWKIGTPCIFYAEHFVRSLDREPAAVKIPLSTLRKVAKVWKEHVR